MVGLRKGREQISLEERRGGRAHCLWTAEGGHPLVRGAPQILNFDAWLMREVQEEGEALGMSSGFRA